MFTSAERLLSGGGYSFLLCFATDLYVFLVDCYFVCANVNSLWVCRCTTTNETPYTRILVEVSFWACTLNMMLNVELIHYPWKNKNKDKTKNELPLVVRTSLLPSFSLCTSTTLTYIHQEQRGIGYSISRQWLRYIYSEHTEDEI